MHTPNFTAQLTDKKRLQEIAASLGCIQTRGSGKDSGSIRLLLEKISSGELVVIPPPPTQDRP